MPRMLSTNINITTYAGETVKLPCELSDLGNYHVNWLKIENHFPQALTVGYQQFSRNMRYRVSRVHDAETNIESWDFEIRRVNHEDQGMYECYVKLSPRHKLRAHVFLTVRDRREFTADPRSERLSSSSSMEKISIVPNNWIKLRCNASNPLFQSSSEQSNSDLQWFKGSLVATLFVVDLTVKNKRALRFLRNITFLNADISTQKKGIGFWFGFGSWIFGYLGLGLGLGNL